METVNAHLGNAQYYPLARAVMGGLISSTFLTLLVLPTLYVFGERVRNWNARLWIKARPQPAFSAGGTPPPGGGGGRPTGGVAPTRGDTAAR